MPSKSEERFWVENYDVTARERPDFLLTFQGEQIGTEVTEGAPETFWRG